MVKYRQDKNLPLQNQASNLMPRAGLVVFLFLLALGIEFLYIKSYNVGYFTSSDGLLYSNIAENFLKGKGLVNTIRDRDYVVGPVYPLLLAFVYGIFGWQNYGMVITLHAVLGAASALLAYKTGERLFGKRYAWVPYGLTLGYPLFPFWGMYVLTETTYVFTITLFLYISVIYAQQVKHPRVITLLVFGAVIGISNLVRPFLLLYFPVLAFWILWMQNWQFKAALRDFCLIVGMTALVMCPWWIRNVVKYHEFIAVSNYGSEEFYKGNNPLTITDHYYVNDQPSYDPAVKARIDKLPIMEQEKEYKQLGEAYIIQHPVQFLQRTLAKEKNLFWQPVLPETARGYKMQGDALDKWYLLLGLIGALLSLFYLKRFSFLLLFTGYYSFLVSMISVVSGARYRLPVMPAVILLGSLAVVVTIKGIVALTMSRRQPIGGNNR